MALPKKLDDPVLVKLAQAQKLIQEAHEELSQRPKHPSRIVASGYLNEIAHLIRRAANYEKRAA